MKDNFEVMEIDDIMMSYDIEQEYQLFVTCFYVAKNKDKEWSFIINLN